MGRTHIFVHPLETALRGLLKLRDFMGASGGATSALLALADPQQSSRSGRASMGVVQMMFFLGDVEMT